jgi:hypothetical protein
VVHVDQHEHVLVVFVFVVELKFLELVFQLVVVLVVVIDVNKLFVYKFVLDFLVLHVLDLDLN